MTHNTLQSTLIFLVEMHLALLEKSMEKIGKCKGLSQIFQEMKV